MAQRRHDELRDALAPYALGALDAAEQRAIDLHLDQCPACRAELTALSDAATVMVDRGPPPRPAVWDRVIASFRDRHAASEEPSPSPTVIEVALVDGAADVRTRWRRQLQSEGGFDVIGEAGDGLSAVELAAARQPQVMVMELSLPRLGGLAAIPRITRSSPGTRVLACSASEEMIGEALLAGASGTLMKEAALEVLGPSVRQLVAY